MIRRGDIVWVDFGIPRGSEPAKVRPSVVVQEDWLLDTNITTVLVVPLTSNTALEGFPGNVLVPAAASGLDRDSMANVSQIGPVSREFVDTYPAGHLAPYLMAQIGTGIRLVLGV